jgi:hypothetical protein
VPPNVLESCVTGDWTQGPPLAREVVLYHLCCAPSTDMHSRHTQLSFDGLVAHFFLALNSIPLSGYTNIDSLTEGSLGC